MSDNDQNAPRDVWGNIIGRVRQMPEAAQRLLMLEENSTDVPHARSAQSGDYGKPAYRWVPWKQQQYRPQITARAQFGYTAFTWQLTGVPPGSYTVQNNCDCWLFLARGTAPNYLGFASSFAVIPPFSSMDVEVGWPDISFIALVAGYEFTTPRGTVLPTEDTLTTDSRGPLASVMMIRTRNATPSQQPGWTRVYDLNDLTAFPASGFLPTNGQIAGVNGTTVVAFTPNVALDGCISYFAVVSVVGLTVGTLTASIQGVTNNGTVFTMASASVTATGIFIIKPTTPVPVPVQAYLELDYTIPGGSSNTNITIQDASVFIDMPE